MAERNRTLRRSASWIWAMWCFGIAVAEAFFVDHFFAVVGPAFGEGVADEELADFGVGAVGVEELHEVAGVNFVGAGEEEAGAAGDVGVLLRLSARLGRAAKCNRSRGGLFRTGPGC